MSNSIDEATISISSGNGGNGSHHLKREKYNAKGGPDGGNGGKGGDVYIEASNNINTLIYYTKTLIFKAEDGKAGGSNNCTGRNGKDVILRVPIGTQVYDENKNILHDFTKNERAKFLIGGKGGAGNTNYKTSTNQTPTKSKPGEPGETKNIKLILKTLADIGIIGKPNVGKSSLIAHLTNAKVKIGDYEFTTLHPNIGILIKDNYRYTICDIPGLILGASQGRGLGTRFLKHIERCNILLHLIDGTNDNPIKNYHEIQHELKNYSTDLTVKQQIICISKSEEISETKRQQIIKKFHTQLKKNIPIYFLSTHNNYGIEDILKHCHEILSTQKSLKIQNSNTAATNTETTNDTENSYNSDNSNNNTDVSNDNNNTAKNPSKN